MRGNITAPRRRSGYAIEPLTFLRGFDSVIEDFFRATDVAPVTEKTFDFHPTWDVKETSEAISIKAELPGMSDKDINLELGKNFLRLTGHKQEERSEEGERSHFTERRWGSFSRSIQFSDEIDEDRVEAKCKDGILEITLPKSEMAKKGVKKISVKKE